MKRINLLLAGMLLSAITFGVPKYWVGPFNGNWNNSAYWSLTSGGPGLAGVPDNSDSVVILNNATILLDISPAVGSMTIGSFGNFSTIRLYANTAATLTLSRYLTVTPTCILKDSVSADIPFNFIVSGSAAARVTVFGTWEFEGGVAISPGAGPFFTAETGSIVTIGNNSNATGLTPTLLFKNYAGTVSSTLSSLVFTHYSYCTFQNSQQVRIPIATWAETSPGSGGVTIPDQTAALISILGSAATVQHIQPAPAYGSMLVNLPAQTTDLALALRDGTQIKGNLEITNTNGRTITLLENTAPATTVSINYQGALTGGALLLSGATTKVALSTAVPGGPAINYRLQVNTSMVQTGGNFSLQDNDNTAGTATLAIRNDLNNSGGTFFSGSNVPNKRLVIEMSGPVYVPRPGGNISLGQRITMNSGSMDNPGHSLILRVAQLVPDSDPNRFQAETGVVLQSLLSVPKLELIRGMVYTTAANLLSITDPNTSAVISGADASSYVIGPFQRATNAATTYLLPTGAPPTYTGGFTAVANITFHKDSAYIIPVSATPSVYRTQYFPNAYADITSLTAPLLAVSNNKYWDISKVSGADAAIRLILNSAVPGATADRALVVAHYTGGTWVTVNGSSLTPGNSAIGFITSKVISSFSPFTFGVLSPTEIPLAIHFVNFTARKAAAGAILDWTVESAPARFQVLRSGDGIRYTAIGTMTAAQQKSYQYTDEKLLPGTNYYRIRAIESDGNLSLSVVSAVLNGNNALAITQLAPNQVRQTATLFIQTAKAGKLTLVITDISGRNWKRLTIDVSAGPIEKSLNLADLPAGNYQLRGYMNELQSTPLRFVKL